MDMYAWFTYNPFAVDGPGKPYCTRTAAQLWRKYELRDERPNTYNEAVVGDFKPTITSK